MPECSSPAGLPLGELVARYPALGLVRVSPVPPAAVVASSTLKKAPPVAISLFRARHPPFFIVSSDPLYGGGRVMVFVGVPPAFPDFWHATVAVVLAGAILPDPFMLAITFLVINIET